MTESCSVGCTASLMSSALRSGQVARKVRHESGGVLIRFMTLSQIYTCTGRSLSAVGQASESLGHSSSSLTLASVLPVPPVPNNTRFPNESSSHRSELPL